MKLYLPTGHIELAVSKDVTRKALTYVHVYSDDVGIHWEATDTRILAHETIQAHDDDVPAALADRGILIPVEAMKAARKAAKQIKSQAPFFVVTELNGKTVVAVGLHSWSVKDGLDFPKTEKMFYANRNKRRAEVIIDAAMLLQLAKSLASGQRKFGVTLGIDLDDLGAPIEVGYAPNQQALMMPRGEK